MNNKTKARAVIKYLQKMGMATKKQNGTPSYSTVAVGQHRRWPRRLKTSTTDEQVDAIHRVILDHKRVTIQQIAKNTNISASRVHTILTDILAINKLSARWIPRMLTPEQTNSRICFTRFLSDPNKFFRRLETQDEAWVYHFKPGSNHRPPLIKANSEYWQAEWPPCFGIMKVWDIKKSVTLIMVSTTEL